MNSIMKTTFPDEVMIKIADLSEKELKEKHIYYERSGTVFNVFPHNINDLLDAQMNSSLKLMKEGLITHDMIKKDVEHMKRNM